jgi:hypothetical protein
MEIAPTITRELIREVNNLMAYEFENMTEYGQRTLLKLWNEIEKEVEKCKRVYFQNIKQNDEVKN